jgi:acetyltransferase-like isoleucine patch superfamily enzyme
MNFKARIAAGLVELPLGLRLLLFWRNLRALPARRRAIGTGSFVSRRVRAIVWRNLKIGSMTIVCDDTWFLTNRGEESIFIGSHCCIGARNFFTAGSRIVVGDYTLTAPGCAFLGAHHDYSDPWVAQIAAPVTGDGIIEIGVNCAIGANSVILADSKIGHGVMIGAGSVVKGRIPPFSVVVGNPGKVVKRFDPRTRRWLKAAEFQPELESELPDEETCKVELNRRFPRLRTFPGFIYGRM